MSADLEQQIQALQAENETLRRAVEQPGSATNEDLARLQAELAQMIRLAEEKEAWEQTIREIVKQMQASTSLAELVRLTAEVLNSHFDAQYTLIELGTTTDFE